MSRLFFILLRTKRKNHSFETFLFIFFRPRKKKNEFTALTLWGCSIQFSWPRSIRTRFSFMYILFAAIHHESIFLTYIRSAGLRCFPNIPVRLQITPWSSRETGKKNKQLLTEFVYVHENRPEIKVFGSIHSRQKRKGFNSTRRFI